MICARRSAHISQIFELLFYCGRMPSYHVDVAIGGSRGTLFVQHAALCHRVTADVAAEALIARRSGRVANLAVKIEFGRVTLRLESWGV